MAPSDPHSAIGAAPGWHRGRVLDVRPAAAFAAGHLRGSASRPLPEPPWAPAVLQEWLPSIFLPPRHEPLLVVAADGAAAAAVSDHLRGKGRSGLDHVVLAAADLAALPAEWLARGPVRGRLWEPAPWLRCHGRLLPPPARGPVLDLGCGSGRAAVWLAARGYAVTGVDHQPEALEFGRRLAADEGCSCRFVAADLRDPATWPAGPWAVVVNLRYLQRDLLVWVAGNLLPGGVAVVRTFRDAPGHTGHPRPRHRLAPGELLGAFPRGHFEILAHAEDFDPDGAPAAGIVARRRAAPVT